MSSNHRHEHLLFALRRIVRSLARLLIRVGIRFDEFATLAQEVYVESAISGIDHRGIPSRERIAALTGLTRKQVDRCVDREKPLSTADPTLMSLVVEVLHKWHTSPEYAGPYGIPLELEFDDASNRNFRSVVAAVNPDANPQVVLEELLRTGAVAQAGDKHFRTMNRYFLMLESMSPSQIEYFGMTLSRLAATLEYNMNTKDPEEKWLARRVVADRGLSLELVPAFEKFARGKTIDFLLELDNWIASHTPDDLDAADRIDTGVNVFLYVESPGTTEQLAALVDGPEFKRGVNA